VAYMLATATTRGGAGRRDCPRAWKHRTRSRHASQPKIAEICGSLPNWTSTPTRSLWAISRSRSSSSPANWTGPHADYFIDTHESNIELAKMCLTYLCLDHFHDGCCVTGENLAPRCEPWAAGPLHKYTHARAGACTRRSTGSQTTRLSLHRRALIPRKGLGEKLRRLDAGLRK
jgi:hypothetical protein